MIDIHESAFADYWQTRWFELTDDADTIERRRRIAHDAFEAGIEYAYRAQEPEAVKE